MNNQQPCQNKNCISWIEGEGISNCTNVYDMYDSAMQKCILYQPEPQESAWEMFRRLEKKINKMIDVLIDERNKTGSGWARDMIVIEIQTLRRCVKIMTEIEKGLEE